jgi:hypothetical protein
MLADRMRGLPWHDEEWTENCVTDQDQFVGRLMHNRYALDAVLATGAAGVVYRGRDAVLNRPVAIKAVPLADAAPYRKALALTAGLTHPAVVALYDTLDADEWLLLIQELVDGRPLSAYVRPGLPSERALDIGAQIARALDYAHAHGIIHGDLTANAVIVDRQAIVRINNFGLPPDSAYFARLCRSLEGNMPTQRADSEAAQPGIVAASATRWEVTPAADVRAAALLLWQVLTEPQAGDEEMRAFRADVPEQVRTVVWRAALPVGADAITDARTLALALDEVAAASARRLPAIPELTPPALRALRVAGPSAPPPWAGNEAYAAGDWGEVIERQPALATARPDAAPTEVGAPHLRLPSRPVGQAPRWPSQAPGAISSGRTRAPAPPAGQVNVALVIAIGIALFILFFLIGYVAQPIQLP